MNGRTMLIAFSIAGFLAWLLNRRRVTSPAANDPWVVTRPTPDLPRSAAPTAPGGFSHWRKLDDDAVERFATANAQRVLATNRGDAAAARRWQAEYDKWFALHREYAAKANEAWNRERGIG